MASKLGKSILIFSSKGGVGKSTIAICLAGIFSRLNKKTLIVDFDFSSGAIGVMLNKPSDKTVYNFVDDYQNNRYNSLKDYITKYNENIDFISSCKDPRQGVQIESAYVEIIIEKARCEYDFVIIDTNHLLSEFNVSLLDKCDESFLVLSNDLIDLKNTRNLINIFKACNAEPPEFLFE